MGSRKIEGALFLNKFGNPVSDKLVSSRFFNLAVNADIQKKIINKQYKIGSHELRDLLKSTLIDSGCRIDVADHVIGHKPKDSYEKQSKLYPETMRKKYSKASKRLNIFTKLSNMISGKDDPDVILTELIENPNDLQNERLQLYYFLVLISTIILVILGMVA